MCRFRGQTWLQDVDIDRQVDRALRNALFGLRDDTGGAEVVDQVSGNHLETERRVGGEILTAVERTSDIDGRMTVLTVGDSVSASGGVGIRYRVLERPTQFLLIFVSEDVQVVHDPAGQWPTARPTGEKVRSSSHSAATED